MKPTQWMTPGEHRLAVLLLVLAVLGSAVNGIQRLSPEISAWLAEPFPEADSPPAPEAPYREPQEPPTIVDPNKATENQLDSLPGIGPALAKRIVHYRPYQSAEDLLRVPGIGRVTLKKMESRLVFADSAQVGHNPQAS